MKPDWDSLAATYANSDKVLVADVDCTGEGEPLCSRFGVEGFPTIKVFNPPDEEGEDYEGGRDLAALEEFAKTLGPGCSASALENCSDEQKAELEAVMAMSEADRDEEYAATKKHLADMEETHDILLKELQAQYESSQEQVESFKKETKPRLKLLKAAGATAPAATGNDKDEM